MAWQDGVPSLSWYVPPPAACRLCCGGSAPAVLDPWSLNDCDGCCYGCCCCCALRMMTSATARFSRGIAARNRSRTNSKKRYDRHEAWRGTGKAKRGASHDGGFGGTGWGGAPTATNTRRGSRGAERGVGDGRAGRSAFAWQGGRGGKRAGGGTRERGRAAAPPRRARRTVPCNIKPHQIYNRTGIRHARLPRPNARTPTTRVQKRLVQFSNKPS